jgi:periplasmic copper chaperone A
MKLKGYPLLRSVFLVGICAFAHAAWAADIAVSNAWVRWLPGGLPAAGYITMENLSGKNIDLVAVKSPDYRSAMLHQSVHNGSTDQMIMVSHLTIPAHGKAALTPGDYHLMLEQATHAIAPGNTVHVQLEFSDGSSLNVPMLVSPPSRTQ